MTASLHRLTLALLAAFASLALTTGYWTFVRGNTLTSRNDNPRNFIAETRIRRGRILDRRGAVLAETRGEPGGYLRLYPLPEAVPVVGYASLRYGVAGVEEAENAVLRGEAGRSPLGENWQTGVLGAPQLGRDVQLTLDAEVQRGAAAALGGNAGAVVVLDALTGDVLAMVSAPAFDPNTLDADWETLVADRRAPLLNRASLGSYQPGGALQAILFAAALDRGLAAPDQTFGGGGQPIAWRGAVLGCPAPKDAELTLAAAFALACPSPFAELGMPMSTADLAQVLADFGLFDAPEFPLPTAASPFTAIPENPAAHRLAAAGLGDLRVSPLQMALVAAAFANHGMIPTLQLIAATQDAGGRWTPQPIRGHPISAIGASSAEAVAALFSSTEGNGRLYVGHASLALTGPQAEQIAWYLGFASAAAPKFAIAVLVENGTTTRATEIGTAALAAAGE